MQFITKGRRWTNMPGHQDPIKKFDLLRRQAEELIRQQQDVVSASPTDILELIHELRVYQAELEIQNDNLRQTQLDLSDLHHEFEDLYEFAPCGYVTINSKGIITRSNLTAAMLLDGLREGISYTGFNRYLVPGWEDFYINACKRAGETGGKQSLELLLNTKGETPLWVRADIIADRTEAGKVIQWRMVLADITSRKKAEEKIRTLNQTLEQRVAERTVELENRTRQLQQLALELADAEGHERRRIASILHDDFQQQLAYIKIELAMLQKDVDPKIGQRLEFLRHLIGESIEKSRNLSYKLNPPALHRNGLLVALDVLAQDMKDKHGLVVQVRTLPDAEPDSLTLASILYRSVMELLTNVSKHSGVDAAVVDLRSQNGMIHIRVEDFGSGFDYDTVRSRQGRGAGFGLYNIEDICNFLGGSMEIKTTPGKGCRVVLIVPRDVARKAVYPEPPLERTVNRELMGVEPAEPAQALDESGQIRILLADDHQLIREALSKLLQGCKGLIIVGQAIDGREVLQMAAQLKPHVILMDVTMPKFDGFEATARITHAHPAIRIIGLSIHNDADTLQKMRHAGASAYLTKTSSLETLVETIRRVHYRNM
jgi:signal transduction histidine kinase/ActR/RegA family two-component response regulator